MLRGCLLVLFYCISAVTVSQAQQDTFVQYQTETKHHKKLILAVSLQTALPQGDFALDVPKAGYGANFQLGFRLPNLPLEIGTSFDFIFYGYQQAGRTIGPTAQPNFEILVDRFQYMLPLHLHMRYAPVWGKFSPHAEIFGGMRLIASRTRATGNALITTPENPEAFSARADYYDFTYSYGVGAGIAYTLADFSNIKYQFILGSRLLRGGKANYLSTNDLQLNGNQLVYTPRYNESNLVLLQLGFSAHF